MVGLENTASARVRVELADDKASVSVDLRGGLPAALGPDEVDELIRNLGILRMHMTTPVSAEPVPGEVSAVINPTLRVPSTEIPDGRIVVLRHPGYGWLHFVFRTPEAIALGEILLKPMLSFQEPALTAKN